MELTLGAVVRRGLVAGASAGVVACLVALFAVEPAIRRALAVEEARSAAEATSDHDHGGLVGRTTQVIGGMVAAVVVAVCLGLVVAIVFARIRHRLPGATDFGRAGALAACGFVAVALVPAVKYPANPPGVGDPATINTRTLQYVSLIAASIAILALAFLVRDTALRRGWRPPVAAAVAAAVGVVALVLAVVVWPDTPDVVPGDVPATLLWEFRLASVAELAAMWATLGLVFGVLLTGTRTRSPEPARV